MKDSDALALFIRPKIGPFYPTLNGPSPPTLTPELIVEKKSITISVSEGEVNVEIKNGYGVSCKSSDSAVVDIYTSYIEDESFFILCLYKPGTVTVTVTDCAGRTEDISVTLTDAVWGLDKSSITAFLSDEYGEICIESDDWNNTYTWTCSNKKVVKVDGDSTSAWLTYTGVWKAVITVKDQFGEKVTCSVTVKPDKISFEQSSVKLNKYLGSGDFSDTAFYL